jgi:hypothetical protein
MKKKNITTKNTQPKQKFKQHGYGWDSIKKQWYLDAYIWEIDEVKYDYLKDGESEVKSGITKEDVYEASESARPIRGRNTGTIHHWGFEIDRLFFPKKLKLKNESKVSELVSLIDESVNNKLKPYQSREIRKRDDIGTEFFIGKSNFIINHIINVWQTTFETICKNEIGEIEKENPTPFEFRAESQNEVLEKINLATGIKSLSKFLIGAVGGWGKTYLMFGVSYLNQEYAKKSLLTYTSPTIPNVMQLCVAHQIISIRHGVNKMERVTISSGYRTKDMKRLGLKNYSASDSTGELKSLIKRAFLNKNKSKRFGFYVQKESVIGFDFIWNEVAKELLSEGKINKMPKSGQLADEVDVYTGKLNVGRCAIWTASYYDLFSGYSATLKKTPPERIGNKSYIYNDNEKYNGPIIAEITAGKAVDEGSICPVEFRLCSHVGDMREQLEQNKWQHYVLKNGDTIPMSRTLLSSINIMIYGINKDKRKYFCLGVRTKEELNRLTKPYIMGGVYKDPILIQLQKDGLIPKKMKIFGALNEKGKETIVEDFKNSNGGILVVNPWFFRGINCEPIDGLTTSYNIYDVANACQAGYRADRIWLGKKNAIIYINVEEQDSSLGMLEMAKSFIYDSMVYYTTKMKESKLPKPYIGPNGNGHSVTADFGDTIPEELKVYARELQKALTSKDYAALQKIKFIHPYSSDVLLEKCKLYKYVIDLYNNDLPIFNRIVKLNLQKKAFARKKDWKLIPNTKDEFSKWWKAQNWGQQHPEYHIGFAKFKTF